MKSTQTQKVLQYMKDFGSITQFEAFRDLGIMRLAARIADLRRLGYVIESVIETGKNRYEETTRYSRYFLIKEADNG